MFLSTTLYRPVNTEFQINTKDLDAHKAWQSDINSRLPTGSQYFLEIAHNGNGNIIVCIQPGLYDTM